MPDRVGDSRPGPADEPTEVHVGIDILDISAIKDDPQEVEIDFVTSVRWSDARLAPLSSCRVPLESVWSPEVRITNSGRRIPMLPEVVRIGSGGQVEWWNRFQGTIATPHRIDAFPFDSFRIEIAGASLEYPADEVRLDGDPQRISRAKELSVAAWLIGEPTWRASLQAMGASGRDHSFLFLELPARRDSSFYVWKVLLPLVLIVFMSWGVFWIDPTLFGPQVGLSATSMLVLIAFQFSLETRVPRMSYFTRMDEFVLGSSLLVFFAFAEAIASVHLVARHRKGAAQRLDRHSRWAFPVAFALLAIYVLLR